MLARQAARQARGLALPRALSRPVLLVRAASTSSAEPAAEDGKWPKQYADWAPRHPTTVLSSAGYRAPTLTPRPRPNESIESRRARLLYQSRKRGILENDIVLGGYATVHMERLSEALLDQYERLLLENDWDLYYWFTGKKEIPKELDNEMMREICNYVKNKEQLAHRQPDL
jgi:succinate dehydrogenase assembly factor 2